MKLKAIFFQIKFFTLISASFFIFNKSFAQYFVGTGLYDITGPVAEVGMMGYAKPDQIASGLHMRLHARAFIIGDTNGQKRVVFVSADLGHIFTSIKQGVIQKLSEKFGDLYTNENVMLSATHTHSGPGGYAHEALFNITTLGYIKENYDAIVNGIVVAITRAHENIKTSDILINRGEILNASKNRSLPAYENNPAEEKAKYLYPFDTSMTLLRFQNGAHEIGMLNWFSLHPVSMSNLNHLVSPDHKGVASTFFEKEKRIFNEKNNSFVAAFAQSNEGDVSPNINNEPDDPVENDFKRTKEAVTKQFNKAKELYDSAHEMLNGSIDYRHAYIDMSNVLVASEKNNPAQKTCIASLGYGFAAGTEDGLGASIFHEGMLKSNVFIDALTSILTPPSAELKSCQSPKPILLAVGQIKPIAWVSSIQPIQIFRIGNLVLLGVPAEFTTMSGRRLRETVKQIFGDTITDVVIAGLSNSYSGYVATPEEYQTQNYEGGFTLFGPNTLPAYQQEFARIAKDLRDNQISLSTEAPADLKQNQLTFQTGVVFDDVPPGKKFGDVKDDILSQYKFGEKISVSFWAGHPKNNLKLDESYFVIEKQEGANWLKIADDNDWDTRFNWERIGTSYSKATITWQTTSNTLAGKYRIRHFGNYKNGWTGKIYAYEGVSKVFEVTMN